MSLGSVVITIVMCVLFNIILPTGDVKSDLYLKYQTLTFNLGETLELEGCKSCFHKNENEVYYPDKYVTNSECKTDLFDKEHDCGNLPFLKKLREIENEIGNCSNNKPVIRTCDECTGECDERSDVCCVTQTNEPKKENPIQKLDPKKSFACTYYVENELDYCIVSGIASLIYCMNFQYSTNYKELRSERHMLVEASTTNETIFFYPYSRINETWIMEEKNHSIIDPDIKCGLLFFRHSREYNEQRKGEVFTYSHHYNEDSCLTHLRSLRKTTSITNLMKWRTTTDYSVGIKIGGKTCGLLQIYGISMLIPILLNFSFNVVLFVNDLRKKRANIFEIVPLLLLFYPQYKTIKFLAQYLKNRDENILKKEIESHDRTVSQLEPWLESSLQVRYQINKRCSMTICIILEQIIGYI